VILLGSKHKTDRKGRPSKFTTLIPTHRNDGEPVDPAYLPLLVRQWSILFGGCTVEGLCFGHWIDTRDGGHYQDESVRVSVVCDNDLYDDAVAAVLEVGMALGQEAMYFELRDFDGVRILRVK
jgi:hypothetical protein